MDHEAILDLWKSYDRQLAESLALNRQNAEDITRMKVQSFITAMKPTKIFTILVGALWVGLGSVVVFNIFLFSFAEASLFFLFSATIQIALTALALLIYLQQLVTLYQLDLSGPILLVQEKLAGLKNSTLWIARILLLQLPLWTVFYWNKSMLENGSLGWYLIQLVVTGSFTYLAGWLFFNIKYENRHKKWFQLIFHGKEWTPLMKAMDLLEQIADYKMDK